MTPTTIDGPSKPTVSSSNLLGGASDIIQQIGYAGALSGLPMGYIGGAR